MDKAITEIVEILIASQEKNNQIQACLEQATSELNKAKSSLVNSSNESLECHLQIEHLTKQLEASRAELQGVAGERDERAKEKGEAQQQLAERNMQLEAKGGELQKVLNEREALAKEYAEAQKQLVELKQQLDAKGAELFAEEAKTRTLRQERELSDQATVVIEKKIESILIEKSALESVLKGVQVSCDCYVAQRNEAVNSLDSFRVEHQELSVQMEQIKHQSLQDLEVFRETQQNLDAQLVEANRQLQLTSDAVNAKEREANNATEEAEITLLKLYQVQEELECYFFDSRTKDYLIRQYSAQAEQFKIIISDLIKS